jgi:hypothetical protein
MAYIYKHIRKDTKEVFYIGIGSDSNYKRAKDTNGRNLHWKNIIKKTEYGVEIIKDNILWHTACQLEKELIKKYGRKDLNEGTLVNMTDGGEGVNNLIISNETRQKLSELHKGKPKSEEHKQKMRKPKSEEHKQKIGISGKGRKATNETKQKMKDYHTGRLRSDVHKKKISESLKGNKHSEEAKQKMRDYHSGKVLTNETKEKIRQSQIGNKHCLGKKHSEETKQKMRDARIKYYQNKFGNME